MDKHRYRTIIISAAILILAIVAMSVWGIINRAKKTSTLEIAVAPTDAKVSIDGKHFGNGTFKLEPGTYHVEITKDGFDSYQSDIELRANETSYLYEYLTQPNGDMSWYADHKKDLMLLNSVGDKKADVESKAYASRDPILKITPYRSYDDGFNIEPYIDDADNLIVEIKLLSCQPNRRELLKDSVREWFTKHDLDIENYTVKYISDC